MRAASSLLPKRELMIKICLLPKRELMIKIYAAKREEYCERCKHAGERAEAGGDTCSRTHQADAERSERRRPYNQMFSEET